MAVGLVDAVPAPTTVLAGFGDISVTLTIFEFLNYLINGL
jgi:hypothetical protein